MTARSAVERAATRLRKRHARTVAKLKKAMEVLAEELRRKA